jgi:hypothetical protein
MATQLTLPTNGAVRFARDGSWSAEPLPGLADAEGREGARGSFAGEVRSVLRIAATIGAIALLAYAVIFVVALLALLGVP